MSTFGTPIEWVNLLEPMVPQIIDLVLRTWEGTPQPGADERENDISNRFCAALRQGRSRREYQSQIHPQAVILEPEAGEELGRMDIAFWPLIPSEEIYFCLECKRLNVVRNGQVRPYSAEYVAHGMLRFVTGQYSRAVRHGGMLGYVLDGNVNGAMANVEENIRNRHAELGMEPPGAFLDSGVRPDDSRVRETRHHRTHDPQLFRIHHLFMAGTVRTATKGKPTAPGHGGLPKGSGPKERSE
jgi:hypothetical protein